MKTNGHDLHTVTWGKARIEFRLRHSDRRTLAITVQPDLRVLVTAPRKAAPEIVLARVRKRVGWIRRQQRFFWGFQPQMPLRQYVSGETHYYLGRQYRLKVVEADDPDVKLKGRFIWVHTQRKKDLTRVRKLLETWYLIRASERFAYSLTENAARLGRRLVTSPRLQLRRMPKRWGSWTKRGVIYLNPELILAPPSCIDYVLTHELCHLVHASHGTEFFALLRKTMPDWEQRKARLEQLVAESGVR